MTARGIQDVAARWAREKAGLSRHRTEQEREERECPNLASPRKGSREKDAAIIHAAAAAAVDREAVTRSLYFIGRTMAKYLEEEETNKKMDKTLWEIELRALQGRGEIYAGRVGVQGRAVNQMNGNGRGEEGRSQAHFVQALRHARLKAASSFLLPFLSVKLFARLNSPPSHK